MIQKIPQVYEAFLFSSQSPIQSETTNIFTICFTAKRRTLHVQLFFWGKRYFKSAFIKSLIYQWDFASSCSLCSVRSKETFQPS